jgi:hypothetical protein
VGRDGRIAWRSLAETYRERPASIVLEALEGIVERRAYDGSHR